MLQIWHFSAHCYIRFECQEEYSLSNKKILKYLFIIFILMVSWLVSSIATRMYIYPKNIPQPQKLLFQNPEFFSTLSKGFTTIFRINWCFMMECFSIYLILSISMNTGYDLQCHALWITPLLFLTFSVNNKMEELSQLKSLHVQNMQNN